MSTKSAATNKRRPARLIPEELSSRVRIENVQPLIDGGRFPVKRTVGERILASADVLADGHDALRARIRYRRMGQNGWTNLLMDFLGRDQWQAGFEVRELGSYEFVVEAWVDRFASWRDDLLKKSEAGQNVESELLEGAALVRRASEGAPKKKAQWLGERASLLENTTHEMALRVEGAISPELEAAMLAHSKPDGVVTTRPVSLTVERERARVGAWYEMFPRSAGTDPSISATFEEASKQLPYIASMGFDVVYLPPIHPIGKTHRKGPNNILEATPSDPGSPWAIGSEEGGHRAVDPGLGTLEDFERFVARARDIGLEIALDIAFQCSPDHPYVVEHPEWFRHRPDGSIKYAENPPKKYQDIYPLDFECDDWRGLWQELLEVVLFWIDRGVRIFRVDNPHTKTFGFWEWMIREVRAQHPEAVFLAEAFTRPKVLRHLAKCGFSQSYTYFTWRNTKDELTTFLTDLTQTDVREYLRPNFFANTPDILHEYLQFGGRAAFEARLVLAATTSSSYGIYGPPYELCEANAVPGTEEYRDSEKYQIRVWDRDRPGNIKSFIKRVNQIRRENPALRENWNLRFHPVDNDRILFYSKVSADGSNVILVVVNLDPHHPQSGWVDVPLGDLGVDAERPFQVHDLLSDARYLWQGARNYVQLRPSESAAHILRLRRKIKTEKDFDYYL
jgi:starch synthase (maltosyl-transferring)